MNLHRPARTLLLVTVLAGLLAPAAAFARAACPSTEPGLVDGIGFVPAPGALSCWWPGWNATGAATCAPMDLSAQPFDGQVADHTAFVRRYGFDRAECGTCHFGVDAESLLGAGSVNLQNSCCSGSFGTAATHTCYPTMTELHDFAATNPGWQPITVHNPPGLTISGPTTAALGSPITLTAIADNCTAGDFYVWNVADGILKSGGTGATVQVAWNTTGAKMVTVTNALCSGAVGKRQVIVSNSTSGPLAAAFTFSPAAPTILETVEFDASATTGGATVYFWEFGDGTTFDGIKGYKVYTSPGSYAVKLTAAKACVSGICGEQSILTKTVVVGGSGLTAALATSAQCNAEGTGAVCQARTGQVVTFTSTGAPGTQSTWSFGDGGSAVGQQVQHQWTAAGNYFVQLTVSNGLTSGTTHRTFQVTEAPAVAKRHLVVPWIAGSTGLLTQKSDLYLHNAGPGAADVDITFRKRGTPQGTPPKTTRRLLQGETLYLADVMALFGLTSDAGFLYLESRPVTESSSAPQLVVVSFNRTFEGGQAFGQSVPGVAVEEAGGASAVHHLVGMTDDDERTAYFGISNPNGGKASYHLTFFDRDGDQIATTKGGAAHVVAAYGQKQYQTSVIRDLGVVAEQDYRVEIETVEGGPLFPFGATRRLSTDDPSYIPAELESGQQRQYLLGLITGPGLLGSVWAADAVVVNPTAQPMQVTLRFVPVGLKSAPSAPRAKTLAPGESLRLVDVLDEEWNLTSAKGVLVVDSVPNGGVSALVLGETYDRADLGAIYGQTVMAQAIGDAATAGTAQALIGLRQDADYRTVVWLYNPHPTETANLELIYRRGDGSELGRKPYTLSAGAARQLTEGQHLLPAGWANAFSLEIRVSSGALLSGAQVVNNENNDPAYTVGATRQ